MPHTKKSFSGSSIVFIVILACVVSLLWALPFGIGTPHASNEPLEFEGGIHTDYTQENVCGCRNPDTLHFGTDERQVSNTYFTQSASLNEPDKRGLNTYGWAWGQFMDHDIVRSDTDPESPIYTIPFNDNIDITVKRVKHVISNPAENCRVSENFLTPAIDASTVYSDSRDPERLAQLRVSPTSCKLRVDSYGLPPINQEDNNFFCGDVRCGEHVVLTSLHTLFIREHNRWCDVLRAQQSSPHKTDNERFWEARRLIISIIQKITYTEWLPALFGSQYNLLERVHPRGKGLAISSAFGVAAYRLHSMVSNHLGDWPLAQLFFNNDFIRTNGIESVLTAAARTESQAVDTKAADTLRNSLFGTHGVDLITLNLFRGRSLGIPSYAQLTQCYNLEAHPGITSADTHLALLQEPVEPGSSLPKTMAHIIAEQFGRLRDNDPNFYTKMRSRIGSVNYAAVLQTTLRQLIIRNTQLTDFPQNPFFLQ